jgi:putative peptide zinc metalloprotease protein
VAETRRRESVAGSTSIRGQPEVAGEQDQQPAQPALSADGRWWWDGQQWLPVATDPPERPAPAGGGLPVARDHGPVSAPAKPGPVPDSGFHAEAFLRPRQRSLPSMQRARQLLEEVSRGAIKATPNAREQRRQQLLDAARTPVERPPTRLAFISSKGGVGKTTTCLLTTSRLGLVRHDRLIAVEANPHHGTFRSRVQANHNRSVHDLLAALDQMRSDDQLSYPMLHRFTTQADENRLEVLMIPLDPALSQALGEEEYRRVLRILYRFYDVVALDLGTGLLEPSTAYMLRVCDQAVVVSPAALDGGKLADYTLDYIEARRGSYWLRERAIVVINGVRKDTLLEVDAMERHFRKRARLCHRIRWDRHLEAGGIFDWKDVSSGTRDDYLELAAAVASGFSLGPSPDSPIEGE